ncbi:hypothetical protein L7F22_064297 [Adiantum nelumboides]|nr:hypothetical protein [Adiantum nelumboides]
MGLSDNKRKQRLVGSASGRNAAWSGNEALPGQRLLASMGWQAGQGLGTSQQGMSAPVTMAFKLDNKGIGARRHEREARASGKVDAWIGGGGDLGSLFERLNRAATSANAEEGAAHGDDDDDDDDDKSQEAGEAEKGKGEKKRKRDKDDKKKRKEEKRKAKEERLDDKGNKGKGKEKAPEDSGVAKVEHKPIRQA